MMNIRSLLLACALGAAVVGTALPAAAQAYWVPGHYAHRPYPGAAWHPGHWARGPYGWYLRRGHWGAPY